MDRANIILQKIICVVSAVAKIFALIFVLSRVFSVSGQSQTRPPEYYDDDDDPPPRLRDIPDKYYDTLMQEIPELRQIMAEFTARRNSAPYRDSMRHPMTIPTRSPDPKANTPFNTSRIGSGRRVYQNYPQWDGSWWKIWWGEQYITRRQFWRRQKYYNVSACFWCGMNLSNYVPSTSLCHDAFDSQNGRARALQRFFRGRCYYTNPIFVNFGGRTILTYSLKYYGSFQGWNNMLYGAYYGKAANESDKEYKGKWGIGYFFDYGLKKNYFGQYIGGCFKRYLDVGTIYTQRGCKHYFPINTYGASSAAHRFKRLEYVLRWRDEGCVSSTHASLTPFNRGISLYARYHVCVCSSRYCNRVAPTVRVNIILWVAVLASSLILI